MGKRSKERERRDSERERKKVRGREGERKIDKERFNLFFFNYPRVVLA